MDLGSVVDFAEQGNKEIRGLMVSVILSPEKLKRDNYVLGTLNWDSIVYNNAAEIDKIPNDKRGLYAFVVSHPDNVLPPHGYVLYIGIAGKNSKRSLRERYKDYLNAKKVLRRAGIARIIGTWHEVLRFYFAPIEDSVSTEDLQELEKQLNTALVPPFSRGDLEADTKRKRGAFV